MLDLAEGLGGGFLSGIAASAQDLHYRGRVFRQLLTAGPDRLQRLLQDVIQEFLYFHIAQTAPLIVSLQLVQIGVVRQVAGEVFIGAESIQIEEHGVVLGIAGVGHLKMVGVGKHTHDLGADIIRCVGQIDAVAKRLAHLGLAVRTGKAEACLVVRQQSGGFHQYFAVQLVEAANDLAGLLQHGQLILANGDGVRHKGGDVRRLADGVGQKPHGDAVVKASQLDLRLHGGIAFQPGQCYQIHVVECQLRQLADMRLNQNGGFFRINAAGHIVQRHLQNVVPYLLGMIKIIGQRLRVGDHEKQLLESSAVLQRDAVAQGAYIVPHMKPTGRPVACQNDLSHNHFSFLYVRIIKRLKASQSSRPQTRIISNIFPVSAR